MRDLLILFVCVVGCGGSVENQPACGLSMSGWTWERRSGDCGAVPPVSQCDASDTYATTARGVCEVSGDIRCGADIVTVACESGVCFAAVTTATCSGEYTLRAAH